MNNDLQFINTLPSAANIMVEESGETASTYAPENMELEYETIQNAELASDVSVS